MQSITRRTDQVTVKHMLVSPVHACSSQLGGWIEQCSLPPANPIPFTQLAAGICVHQAQPEITQEVVPDGFAVQGIICLRVPLCQFGAEFFPKKVPNFPQKTRQDLALFRQKNQSQTGAEAPSGRCFPVLQSLHQHWHTK